MARDLFWAMSLAPRQKCPRNVVEMKEAMAASFGSDSVRQFLPTVRDQKLFWLLKFAIFFKYYFVFLSHFKTKKIESVYLHQQTFRHFF